ncbi:MAG: carboxynorspermidine decarboxylase [Sphaerochaetaceae bacterium]|jgi:carboxynorspermidine decarboxylase
MALDISKVERTPAFILEHSAFKKNLELIKEVQKQVPARFILALKGFAMHSVFDEITEVVNGATASSLNEALLASEHFNEVHAYAPSYIPSEFDTIAKVAKHITFNSVAQFNLYKDRLKNAKAGLRINPQFSTVETDLYNPCIDGSRLGVVHTQLTTLPKGVSGLHTHNLCENGAFEAKETLKQIEKLYGNHLNSISWLNLGGGHLVTREGYDLELLIKSLNEFHLKYPHLEIILEPGAAFVWETGVLVASVLDVVENNGTTTLMLDTSFAAHMPDTLEMPYKPLLRNGKSVESGGVMLGGSSCLAGDWLGPYHFDKKVEVGDKIVFEDMMHYTMVKTTMFNGLALPDIAIWKDNKLKTVFSSSYDDYKGRLSDG